MLVHPTPQYEGLSQSSPVVRRVVAIPGDSASCHGDGGPLMLNGAAPDEPCLHPGDAPSTIAFDVKVPDGCLWLLGRV